MRICLLFLTISYFLTQRCTGIYLIDLPNPIEEPPKSQNIVIKRRNSQPQTGLNVQKNADHLISPKLLFRTMTEEGEVVEDEKDRNIKTKIATLVQQTVHDTENKIRSIQPLKDKHREQAPYRIGYILSMIKKARDVLNELFNVAVKHRDQWKALEQLKIFELIVHTNVDTTNLVRQLVEIHIQHLNSTAGRTDHRKRVVLL